MYIIVFQSFTQSNCTCSKIYEQEFDRIQETDRNKAVQMYGVRFFKIYLVYLEETNCTKKLNLNAMVNVFSYYSQEHYHSVQNYKSNELYLDYSMNEETRSRLLDKKSKN